MIQIRLIAKTLLILVGLIVLQGCSTKTVYVPTTCQIDMPKIEPFLDCNVEDNVSVIKCMAKNTEYAVKSYNELFKSVQKCK